MIPQIITACFIVIDIIVIQRASRVSSSGSIHSQWWRSCSLCSLILLVSARPVATADERWNIAYLDNVMNVLQLCPLVKKASCPKNELLHAFFQDDSLARTKGEPIAMWLVRNDEQLGKLNRVGIDIVTALRDVANGRH